MRQSVAGLALGIILFGFQLIFMSFYVVGVHSNIKAYHEMMNDTRDFVDGVIDSGQITDQMRADYNMALASHQIIYAAQIYRQVKVVNPDPINSGQTITSWVVVDDSSTFNTGDRITVICEPVSVGPYQAIAQMLLSLPADSNKIQISARVR